jgi:hypothetical protein
MSKKSRSIPFDFVLEELYSLNPVVKPMFGCHAIYVQNKIMLIVRLKEDFPGDNGVWVATTADHHESLRRDFPSMRSIGLFGEGVSSWQNLPQEADDFEEEVLRICSFIRKNDPRIGKIPKAKKKKKD